LSLKSDKIGKGSKTMSYDIWLNFKKRLKHDVGQL